jgi:cell division protein FtsL
MSIDVEYAIKKDIRNNPVVREVDVVQKREFLRMSCLAALMVGLLLFSAWQHLKIISTGYDIQVLQQTKAAEESLNRQLRLEVETLRAPQRIEDLALQKLHMIHPSAKETLILEFAKPVAADKALVALGPAPVEHAR